MPERVAELSVSTIWFFIPSVPLVHRAAGAASVRASGFGRAWRIVVVGTLALYAVMFWAAPRIGMKL